MTACQGVRFGNVVFSSSSCTARQHGVRERVRRVDLAVPYEHRVGLRSPPAAATQPTVSLQPALT